MATVLIDGKKLDVAEGTNLVEAAKQVGVEIPTYCYHPGLTVVGQCRICFVEVEGAPRLVTACSTPVREGMVVHTDNQKVREARAAVMEFLLANHPLDCPVCDQAGECYLQDYSYQYGRSVSRFEEDKAKKPKKDLGLHVLLYNDRCIMCTRCVRFTREVSGTSELYVDGRGHREEIDIFPGKPCDNKLSGNVIDLCPVGALLDKDFLFKQRVWMLKQARSISPADAGGENIYLEHNENVIYRIKPRFNADVNKWWISDDTRYSYKAAHDPARLRVARKVQYGSQVDVASAKAIEQAETDLKQLVATNGEGVLYAMLSPMMACEEAWLLGTWIRSIDKKALLVLGPVPTSGQNEKFFNSLTRQQTFEIQAEKVPNAAGIRRILKKLGGPQMEWDAFAAGTEASIKALKGGWIVGGYLSPWLPKALPAHVTKGYRVVQDILPNALTEKADILLPAASWAEKDGCWENYAGIIQAFEAAVTPPRGAMREGDVYMKLLSREGRYNAAAVRKELGEPFANVTIPDEETNIPAPEFVEI
jgi:NADH-quinone oxidoreductase subunit G